MYILFLDDLRNPADCVNYMHKKGVDTSIYLKSWVVVRSFEEFTNYITLNGLPDLISFDHDLGDIESENEKTGYDCAKWLVNYCLENNNAFPNYLIHSANPIGEQNINGLIDSFKRFNKK
jgi:hypothetical protein